MTLHGDVPVAEATEAGRVDRRLRALPEADDPGHELGVRLRLDRTPHHAERHQRRAALRHEPGDDGVERPLPRRDDVGARRLQRKGRAAILEADPVGRLDAARPEPLVVGLDERDHHPVRARGCERHRPAFERLAGLGRGGLVWIHQRGASVEVGGIEEVGRGDAHRGDVADVGVKVRKRELHGLDREMDGVRPIRVAAEIEPVEDAERDQRCDPLPVRRDLVRRHPVRVDRDRLHPVRRVAGEVVPRVRPAVRP